MNNENTEIESLLESLEDAEKELNSKATNIPQDILVSSYGPSSVSNKEWQE